MSLKLNIAGVSNIGKIRTNNEDNFYFDGEIMPMYNNGTKEILYKELDNNRPICLGVFDGMGGESKGEMASYYATETFKEEVKNILWEMPEEFLLKTCFQMNKKICEEQEKDKCYMGTTAAILYFYFEKVYICNVGDSRIYQIKNSNIMQVSKDHVVNIVNEKTKPALTQNLGIPEEEMRIEPYISKCNCNKGDKFLICSDGLTDMVAEETILQIVTQPKDVKEIVNELLNTALNNGGKDNTTIIVCEVK